MVARARDCLASRWSVFMKGSEKVEMKKWGAKEGVRWKSVSAAKIIM